MNVKINWLLFERIVFIVSMIFIAWILFMTLYPFRPLVVHTQPYKVIDKNINPGEPILYIIDATKNTDVSPTVSRVIKSDNGDDRFITLSDIQTSVPKGNNTLVSATTNVPIGTPPGKYHLELTITYTVNYFHPPIVVKVQTEQFNVL